MLTTVIARCTEHGKIEIPAYTVRVEIHDNREPFYVFTCPDCSVEIERDTIPLTLSLLLECDEVQVVCTAQPYVDVLELAGME